RDAIEGNLVPIPRRPAHRVSGWTPEPIRHAVADTEQSGPLPRLWRAKRAHREERLEYRFRLGDSGDRTDRIDEGEGEPWSRRPPDQIVGSETRDPQVYVGLPRVGRHRCAYAAKGAGQGQDEQRTSSHARGCEPR